MASAGILIFAFVKFKSSGKLNTIVPFASTLVVLNSFPSAFSVAGVIK